MSYIKKLTNYADPQSFGSKMRRKRGTRLAPIIDACFQQKGSVSVIDMGGEASYWDIFDESFLVERSVKITLVNKDERNIASDRKPHIFTNVVGDCCDLKYPDREFDVAHSNSVIEHLGNWPNMQAFAGEARRIADAYYVQTPNHGFPIEPHFGTPFFHWLPEPLRVAWMMRRDVGHYPRADSLSVALAHVQYVRLLDRRQMADLFPDAELVHEKMCGLTKSFVAVRQL